MLCSRVCQCYRGTRTPQHCSYLRTRSRRVVYLGHLYLRIQSQSCGVPSDWVVAPDPFAMHEPHLGSGPWALGPGHHHTTHSATHWHTTGTSATSAGLAYLTGHSKVPRFQGCFGSGNQLQRVCSAGQGQVRLSGQGQGNQEPQ